MKGSTKLLIVAAALLVAGILLSAIGYGLGAMTLTWGEDGLTIDPTQRAGDRSGSAGLAGGHPAFRRET